MSVYVAELYNHSLCTLQYVYMLMYETLHFSQIYVDLISAWWHLIGQCFKHPHGNLFVKVIILIRTKNLGKVYAKRRVELER